MPDPKHVYMIAGDGVTYTIERDPRVPSPTMTHIFVEMKAEIEGVEHTTMDELYIHHPTGMRVVLLDEPTYWRLKNELEMFKRWMSKRWQTRIRKKEANLLREQIKALKVPTGSENPGARTL